jgi:transcriptional regulator with XRE-family HTH domain
MQYIALMDGASPALAGLIGSRVKHGRLSRRWTLDQLAAAAGVSRRLVVNVEQGAANPSVGTLLRLSDALGIGLPALVAPAEDAELKVVRRDEGAVLWRGRSASRGVLVAGTARPDVLELWDWTLDPEDRHDSEAHASGTKEALQVHQGTVTVTVGGHSAALGAGDAASFPGDVPHAYSNTGTGSAMFSLAVFEPRVGVDSTSEVRHG